MKAFLRTTWEEIDKTNLLRMVVVIVIFVIVTGLAFYLSSAPMRSTGDVPPIWYNNGTESPHMSPI